MAGTRGKLDDDDVRIALGNSVFLAMDDIADALASGAVGHLQQA